MLQKRCIELEDLFQGIIEKGDQGTNDPPIETSKREDRLSVRP